VLPAAAQINGGPPSTTSIGGHFLGVPPSVTSTAGRTLPNALPGVTSIPNYGVQYHYRPYYNGYNYNYGHGSRSYGGGYAYAIPYYYPVDNSAYGYDYVGGGTPDLYSGPPIGPNDPSLHMIVEQPPVDLYNQNLPPAQAYSSPPEPEMPAPAPADVTSNDPTVLVFRNGQHQQVINYAIMGDSLYVFDQGRKRIGLADLDIPATIKANEDAGQEFKVPASPSKKSTPIPQNSSPDQSTTAPASVAAAMP
jgi:hypothetical protein